MNKKMFGLQVCEYVTIYDIGRESKIGDTWAHLKKFCYNNDKQNIMNLLQRRVDYQALVILICESQYNGHIVAQLTGDKS